MKVELEFETPLSKSDRDVLRALAGNPVKETDKPVSAPETPQIKPEGKKKYLKVYGKAKSTIYQIIRDHPGCTTWEISEMVDYSENSIYKHTQTLIQEKKVERNATMPYKYYLKGNNTDLKDAVKGSKVSIMG